MAYTMPSIPWVQSPAEHHTESRLAELAHSPKAQAQRRAEQAARDEIMTSPPLFPTSGPSPRKSRVRKPAWTELQRLPRPASTTAGPVQVTLGIGGQSLSATLPSGTIVTLEPTAHGMRQLLALVRGAAAPRAGQVESHAEPTAVQEYCPADMVRVCHCGTLVEPFMTRCDDCPGALGAGKIRKFDERGQVPKLSLADMDL